MYGYFRYSLAESLKLNIIPGPIMKIKNFSMKQELRGNPVKRVIQLFFFSKKSTQIDNSMEILYLAQTFTVKYLYYTNLF